MTRVAERTSAMIPENLIMEAAFANGVPGSLGKSGVTRYAIARLAGHDHAYAMRIARGIKKPRTLQASATVPTSIELPAQLLETALAQLPEDSPVRGNKSALIRYALALCNEMEPADAEKLALSYRPGRKPKSGTAVAA